MSTNSIPSVDKLLQRVAIADKTQQKEIRISIEEARMLTTELALLTANLSTTISEIKKLLEDIKKSTTEVDIKFDGGSF
jgi:methyl-accepting chemotaxis protein